MTQIFQHKAFKLYSNKYTVSTDGVVTSLKTGNCLAIHHNHSSGQGFVRLSSGIDGIGFSMGLCKLLLLTFKPKGYKPDKIAIALDGDSNNISLDNLEWGTRKEQSLIAMKNSINFNRVQSMGLKFGPINWEKNLICDGEALKKWKENNNYRIHSDDTIKNIKDMLENKLTPTEISKLLNISRSSIYRYKTR